MILDDEFLSALKRFVHEFAVTEQTLGLEAIVEAGPGGHFLDKNHTVRYFRDEHWDPGIWSRQMLGPWMEAGRRLDVDLARERVLQFQSQIEQRRLEPIGMSESLEREVLRVIEQARNRLHANDEV